jgi:hypothetical protein
MRTFVSLACLLAFGCLALPSAPGAQAQDAGAPPAPDPSAALAEVLSAACRGDQTVFANSFTAENATAYRALPADERARLLQRFSLADAPGKPSLSSDQDNHTVLRCEEPGSVTEFRFGAERVNDNLAFIPVTVVDGQSTEFGMVREGGNWKLISLGLVLLDIKQLSVQWAAADLAEKEDAAAEAVQTLSSAIDSYNKTFGKLPDSLAQLGPGPKNQISPAQASLVNAELAQGSSGGYRFRYRVVPDPDTGTDHYVIDAVPENYGTSGKESFMRDTSGKIHGADDHGAVASDGDPIWQGESQQ